MGARILVVDDERSLCEYLAILLRREGHHVDICTAVEDALVFLSKGVTDLVLSDLMLGDRNGLEILHAMGPNPAQRPPIIFMTAYGTIEKAIEAIRGGASDFILKPFQNDVLTAAIRKALVAASGASPQAGASTEPIRGPAARPDATTLASKLVGDSTRMRALREQIEKIAPSESTVLITGESGTGKELVARALHQLSRRATKPFLPLHCAALSEGILESELFGHVKGSFTGAQGDKVGLFVAARGGTIFLDEIGEIPLSTQVKLLRVLQEREVTPVGGIQSQPIDVRIVAATNADLEKMIQRGLFREDLYYRINVIRLQTPPLRDRLPDLPELCQALLARSAKRLGRLVPEIEPDAVELLASHPWPGNIRELENALERALVLCPGPKLRANDFRLGGLPSAGNPTHSVFSAVHPTLQEVERAYIYWTLSQCDWERSRSARTLGLDLATLNQKIETYGLQED